MDSIIKVLFLKEVEIDKKLEEFQASQQSIYDMLSKNSNSDLNQ